LPIGIAYQFVLSHRGLFGLEDVDVFTTSLNCYGGGLLHCHTLPLSLSLQAHWKQKDYFGHNAIEHHAVFLRHSLVETYLNTIPAEDFLQQCLTPFIWGSLKSTGPSVTRLKQLAPPDDFLKCITMALQMAIRLEYRMNDWVTLLGEEVFKRAITEPFDAEYWSKFYYFGKSVPEFVYPLPHVIAIRLSRRGGEYATTKAVEAIKAKLGKRDFLKWVNQKLPTSGETWHEHIKRRFPEEYFYTGQIVETLSW